MSTVSLYTCVSLVVAIILMMTAPTDQWCLFSYPCYLMNTDQTTICGIDSELGAKIFPFRCMLYQSNACNNTKYKPASFRQCLERNPNVVKEFGPEIMHKFAIVNQRTYRRNIFRVFWLYALMGNV